MLANAYIAGLFDGEGCIHVQPNCQVKIYITQKDPDILYLVQSQYGGKVYTKDQCANLQIARKEDQVRFLTAILPYVYVKKSKVEIALQLLELSRSNTTREHLPNGHYAPTNMIERNRLRESFYDPNARGRADS